MQNQFSAANPAAPILGDLRQRVVVTRNDEVANASLMEAPHLLGQKAGRLHGGLIAIVEIAGAARRQPARPGKGQSPG